VIDHHIGVLFVCLGNICRSPLAAALFRHAVAEHGLEDRFLIDSAGTSGYHDGAPPDARSAEVASRRGVTVRGVSRRITEEDLERFDYLVVMDEDNRVEVEHLMESADHRARIRLLREFDPEAAGDLDVPDPYFGGPNGFEHVHDMVERSTRSLLDHLCRRHGL